MIRKLHAVQEFPLALFSIWVGRDKICTFHMFCTKFLVCLKFLKNQAAMLTTTCNAINAPSQQLLNKKCPWCVFHYTRCKPGLTHAENILLKLLRCISGQDADPRVGWGMSIYLFFRVLRVQDLLEVSSKTLLTCLWNEAKGFTFVKSPFL